MQITYRAFRPTDTEDVYRICLLTGAAGKDASDLYPDPQLLGHFYAGPYVRFDPELCLIADLGGRAAGYILGTADSTAFAAWAEDVWFPPLRLQYPLPPPDDPSAEANLRRLVHAGYRPHPVTAAYPGHLHIDLLPGLQGRGVGRQLIQQFCDLLRRRGCPAVHLGVSNTNANAKAFYGKVGFHVIAEYPEWTAFGMKLGG